MTTRYELLDRIGVGGMAEIFRGKAVAAGGFEKPVAIKRILPHLAQQKRFVELLIAEAKVLSLLKHRNIVQIFDVGLGDDGKYFLVMEYVDGRDLGAIQRSLEEKRKRIPFDLCLHVGAEICEALEHAHAARAPDGKPMSLVHRDVSPSNVLLSRAGEVKLTDFGIAKRAEQESTGQHAVRGKFAYISPEQARNEHVDPRSDVFSVAILVWELITNRRLYSGLDDMAALRAVRDPKVPRPTEADPRLPVEIDALMMTALNPRLEKRPTAGQFGAQLRSLRYSLDITAGDPATELAKILEMTDQVERESVSMVAQKPTGKVPGDLWHVVEHTEATVIRIATADAFSMRDKDGASISRAKQVIDRFEEEETRLAALTGEQLKKLRSGETPDSADLDIAPTPHPHPQRPMRLTDERTAARAPLSPEDFDSGPGNDESTRLVSPRDRGRTPKPERYDEPPPTRMVPPSPKAGAPKPIVMPPSPDSFNAQPLLTVAQRERPQMTGVREVELGNTVPARNQQQRSPQPSQPPPARNPQPSQAPPVQAQAAPAVMDDATRNMGPPPKPRGQASVPPISAAQAAGFPPPERPASAQAIPSLVPPPKQMQQMQQQPPPTMMGAMGSGGPQPMMSPNMPVPQSTSLGLPPGPSPKQQTIPPPLALVPHGAPPPPMPAPVRESYPVFGGQQYPPGMGQQQMPQQQMPQHMGQQQMPQHMGQQQMPQHMAPHIASQLPPRAASPTQNDMFDSPHQPGMYGRPSQPQVAGFNRNQKKSGLQPWMLVVGALVMAALAFAVTRAFLS